MTNFYTELLVVAILFTHVTHSVPIKEGSSCSHKVADIVFALDSSKSIWPIDFNRQLDFVKNIIKDFPIGQDGVHVGVVTYGHRIYENFGLDSYFTEQEMASGIDQIQYVGGGTNTGGVIKYSREEMFGTQNGGRNNVDQIMFVITDGYSMNSENTTMEASISKSYGIKMLAVGVGHNVDENELNYIASKVGSHRLMFRVGEFSSLADIKSILADSACQAISTDDTMLSDEGYSNKTDTHDQETARKYCGGKPADIYFVVDASSSIMPVDFQKMLQFIADTVDTFDLGKDATRVGVVVYSDGIHPVITINNNFKHEELKRRILQIAQLKGGTETGSAFEYLRTYGFTKEVSRDDVAHIAIVLTDGQSADIKQTVKEAGTLKEMGTYLYVIGIGNQVDKNELKAIASDPDRKFLYNLENFNALSSIKNILAIKMCKVEAQHEAAADEAGKKTCSPSTDLDVMYVFDAYSIGIQKSDALLKVIDGIIASTESPRVRSGVLTHSCHSVKYAPLSGNGESRELLEGLRPSQSGTLPILLHELRTDAFNEENGGRMYAANLVFMIVDGNLDTYHKTKMAIKRLTYRDNAEVHIVAIGRSLDKRLTELADASKNAHLIQIDDFDDTDKLKEKISVTICEKQFHPKPTY